MYRPAAHVEDDELFLPAGQLGMGWWGDAWDEVKSVAKKVQANPVVRGLEKKAVDYGSKALRGAAESAVDGLADSALSAVGAPELAPMVHGQEKHRAGAAENLGCRTYGEPSLWVFFPPSHLIN